MASAVEAEPSADVLAALRGVRAVVGLVSGSLGRALEQVTLPQLRALVLLRSSGPMPVGELAGVLRVSSSGATRAAARMEKDGWLRRVRPEGDRRVVSLELTGRGKRLVDAVLQGRRAELEAVFARMTEAQRRLVVEGLGTLADASQEPENDPTALMLVLGGPRR